MQLDQILLFFSKYIETELGIVYSEHNYFQLQSRLEEIAQLQGVKSIEKLYELATSGITGQFKQLLLDNGFSVIKTSTHFEAEGGNPTNWLCYFVRT